MWTSIVSYFTSGLSRALPWLILALGAVAGVIGVKKSGEQEAYDIMAQKQQEQTNEALKINQGISNMSDADVAQQLHKFTRD